MHAAVPLMISGAPRGRRHRTGVATVATVALGQAHLPGELPQGGGAQLLQQRQHQIHGRVPPSARLTIVHAAQELRDPRPTIAHKQRGLLRTAQPP